MGVFIRVCVSNPKEMTYTLKAQMRSIPKAELSHPCQVSISEVRMMGVQMKGQNGLDNPVFNKISPSYVSLGFVN